MKSIIIVLVLSILLMCIAPASAAYNMSDFMPEDPIQDMQDMGVWEYIILIIGVLFVLAVVSSAGAILIGMTQGNIGSIMKSTTMANHGSFTILRTIIMVIVAFMALGVIFYFINGGI